MTQHLAHLSDLHFGRTDPRLVDALLEDLSRHRPDIIVISGDLTQNAREREFMRARAFLDRLPAPWLAVPGNHDVPSWNPVTRFLAPFARFKRHITDAEFPVVHGGGWVAVGINTARTYGWHWDWSRGRVSVAQMRGIEALFRSVADGTTKIVVTHHPFLLTQEGQRRGFVGRKTRGLTAFGAAGVDLILSGHVHRAYSAIVPVASVRRPTLVVAHAATATSTRLKDEPNAYNWIAVGAERIEVESRTWRGDRFDGGQVTEYVRRQGRWTTPAAALLAIDSQIQPTP